MRKSIFIHTSDDKPLEKQLTDIFEVLDGMTQASDELHIYLESGGGKIASFMLLCNRLNEMIDQNFNITLHLEYVASAALILSWKFKWLVLCEEDAECIAHIAAIDFGSVYGNIIRHNDPIERLRREYYGKEPQVKFSFLTPDEQKEYEEGKDIWINPVRTRQIFHNRKHPCSIDSSTQ